MLHHGTPPVENETLWNQIYESDVKFGYAFLGEPIADRLNHVVAAWDVTLNEAVFEYKRFLYLASISPELPPPKCIDVVWHAHLDNGRSYFSFWEKLGRLPLLHLKHGPKTKFTDTRICHERKKIRKRYENAFGLYSAEFGEEPNPKIWRKPPSAPPGDVKLSPNAGSVVAMLFVLAALIFFTVLTEGAPHFVVMLVFFLIGCVWMLIAPDGSAGTACDEPSSCASYWMNPGNWPQTEGPPPHDECSGFSSWCPQTSGSHGLEGNGDGG